MPELPEVETVKNALKRKILHKKIHDIKILYPKVFSYPDSRIVKEKIINQEFIDITRRGKWLIFELNDYYLLSHLRMEGKYLYYNLNEKIKKHEEVSFILDDMELRYMDVRKFGKMYLLDKDKLYSDISPLTKLGLEPWDKNLTISYLKNKYKNKNTFIKTSLLDQSIITGIGNIYANEILFLSNINPYRKCLSLTDKELNKIIINTKTILTKAIENGGTTIKSYTSPGHVFGNFQNYLYVHKREKEKCLTCNSLIIKEKINGRSAYYCPNCQK